MDKKDKLYKLTKAHFAHFIKCAEKWLALFGMTDWEVTFYNEEWAHGNRATIRYDAKSRVANINLEPIWQRKPDKTELEDTACHEVLELVLSSLVLKAEDSWSSSMVAADTHMIIHRIQNVIGRGWK